MERIRVAAVSMNGFLGEPERSLAGIGAWCERASAEGAELAVFPELVVHGHCTPNTWEVAEAAAGRHVYEWFASGYAMRARENACFCVYADQAGRAGYVDTYPRDHPNQPHHPGGAVLFGPDGSVLKATQTERIRDEMIVLD